MKKDIVVFRTETFEGSGMTDNGREYHLVSVLLEGIQKGKKAEEFARSS